MYGILTAIFITASFFTMKRSRFRMILALGSLVAAPVMLGVFGGIDGLTFSLVGAFAALFLTLPLSAVGLVSREDVIVSMALGGLLGTVLYGIAFGLAIAFLGIQRLLGIEVPTSAADARISAGQRASYLLAFDEKSALVEIETLKMLRMDELDHTAAAGVDVRTAEDASSEQPDRREVMPWSAGLALATLAILMIGTSM